VTGYLGAWINFSMEYRKICPITIKLCLRRCFDIFNYCLCGGIVAVVNCWPDANATVSVPLLLGKALGSGFSFLAILEQFNLGSYKNTLTKQGKKEIDHNAQETVKKARALLDGDLEKLFENLNEDEDEDDKKDDKKDDTWLINLLRILIKFLRDMNK